MTFVLLRSIAVHGASAMGCPLVIGYPTLTSLHGFANVAVRGLAAAVGLRPAEVRLAGLAPLHHSGRLRAQGRFRNRLTQKRYVWDAQVRPDASRHNYYFSPPEKPMAEADLTVSLLLHVISDAPIGALVDGLGRDAAEEIVGPKAFSGTVQSVSGIAHAADLRDALTKLPAGFLLLNRSLELRSATAFETYRRARDAMRTKATIARELRRAERLLGRLHPIIRQPRDQAIELSPLLRWLRRSRLLSR